MVSALSYVWSPGNIHTLFSVTKKKIRNSKTLGKLLLSTKCISQPSHRLMVDNNKYSRVGKIIQVTANPSIPNITDVAKFLLIII